MIEVLVPYRDGGKTIGRLVESIPWSIPITLWDDQSDNANAEEGVRLAQSFPNVRFVKGKERRYFTGIVNDGFAAIDRKRDVLVLNQDTYFENRDWLHFLEDKRSRYGMIGERIQGRHPAFPLGYMHGTFMFVRADVIASIGFMDDVYYPLWGSTAAYQWKASRAGFEVLPYEKIPGFVHRRTGRYGSSITALLAECTPEERDLFIRTPPLVSVIVPCYNYGRYLPDAVHSLIGGETPLGKMPQQTFSGFEVIIVDDASTDNTEEIGHNLIDPWKGVRYLRNKYNRGTAETYNVGFQAALGKYVTILSADDMRTADSIEKMLSAIEARPDMFVYDTPTKYAEGKIGDPWPLSDYDPARLLMQNMVPAGIMVRKTDWQKAGGYPPTFRDGREDWAFAVALLQAGVCGYRLANPGYLYRREGHNRSLSNTNTLDRQRFVARMRATFPDFYEGRLDPMGCCGKNKSTQTPQSTPTPAMLAADTMREGMTLLEYTGKNVGSVRWRGPSGAYYIFGGNDRDRRKLVANADLDYFLNLREGGASIFSRVNTQATAHPMPTAIEEPAFDDTPSADDVSSWTVSDIKALSLSDEQWRIVREHEADGKGRVTLLAWIDEQLGIAADD